MKISIQWLFDHIDADLSHIDIPHLIQKINETTAEVEQVIQIKTDFDVLALGLARKKVGVATVHIPEWNMNIELKDRADLHDEQWYLIAKDRDGYHWATSKDVGAEKEMLMPAVADGKKLASGSWKKKIAAHDTIFVIDNKSITHRPDLWGHRGFAREVAAFLDLTLKPLSDFIIKKPLHSCDRSAPSTKKMPFSIAIDTSEAITRRFAGLYIPKIVSASSQLWMMIRLARIDSRAIDTLIDATNYAMFDVGQPMHAFDAETLKHTSISVRFAKDKERLRLIDDQEIELTSQDIIIADGDQPVSLAGIMGGKGSSVSNSTKAIFLESANFDATTIRRSAQQHKIRTEASARFEKSLDPHQNITAIERYVKLLSDADIPFEAAAEIVSLGRETAPQKITIGHDFIESRLGATIASSYIKSILHKLGFGIIQKKESHAIHYEITVPTFRASKDINIQEDIVEEIGRFYGWGSIEPVLPLIRTSPKPIHAIEQMSRIKHLLSYGLSMRELWTYAFFDEAFLRSIDWNPGETVRVLEPVSENWQRLVTTLIPNLLKAVAENAAAQDMIAFYESGRTWDKAGKESKKLSGIWWQKKNQIDFYECKSRLNQLFELLGIDIVWTSLHNNAYEWQDEAQSALLMHNDTIIGTAGIIAPSFLKRVCEGSAFVFELNASYMEEFEKPIHRYKPSSKFPSVERDVSILAPLNVTVADISKSIQSVDPLIVSIELVDMFVKKEWKEARALTFRYTMQDAHQTMTKPQADAVSNKIETMLTKMGAEIR